MDANFLSNLVIKKVIHVTDIYSEKGKTNKREDRERWSFIFKYEGETIYNSQGKTLISNFENMVILPKGSTYQWTCIKPGRFFSVEFDCDLTHDSIFSFPIKNNEKMLQLLREMEYILTLKKSTCQLELLKGAYSILITLLHSKQRIYVPSQKQEKIAPALEYLAKHYTQKITNDELARVTGLSTVYFRKLFTQIYGISPIAYLHKLRIKKATEMLQSDFETIADIAFSLGYTDIYDFSRSFKKHTGLSPSKYVKAKIDF